MRKKTSVLVGVLLFVLGVSYQVGRTQSRETLDIYSIDVEGGQSTLYISPSGRSMLVDAGNPGDRDADRIAAVAKQAGLTAIDVMLTTHYDGDHHGGVKDVAARIPIRTFVDHGPRINDPGQPQSPQFQAYVERTDRSYAEAVAGGKHMVVKPGDTIPVEGLDIRVVASNREALKVALPGGGAPNPLCAAYAPHDFDTSENSFSVGLVIRYGTFRMLNLGDLTWNREHDLVCPNNLLGTVDLYLTTHHGLNLSGPPALVHAVKPRVAIMNNAAKKGAAAETMATLRSSPNLEDLWQLHYSVPRPPNAAYYEKAEPGGKDLNTAEQLIANLDEAPTHTPVHYLKVSVRPDGTFTVTNSRNGFSKQYRAAGSQAAAALPMPKYHHIHVNAVNPEASLEWYANYWPSGRKTTIAGFPAFQGGDLYLLYSKVAKQAPGAFDKKLHRSMPQSAFWTFGSGVVDTVGLVERLTKLDPRRYEFLPVYASPDDKTGVIRSALAPQGDQLLTVSQLRERAEREKNAPAAPAQRPGNQDFGYLVDPDGMLVEFNSAQQDHFWSHNHFWHEKPLCAANWYAEHLGMQLPPVRDPKTGEMVPHERWDPCDVPIGEVGYPSFMPQGQLRIPIMNVRFANGTWAAYTRQCRDGRCGPGNDKPLSPSRGQVIDHVALTFPDLNVVMAHLKATNVPIVRGPYKFGETRAIMIEDLDGLGLELIEMK